MSGHPSRGAAAGAPARETPRQKRGNDFTTIGNIGSGAFGQVLEVEDKETHKHYAMKVLSKAHIIREKKMNYVIVERDVLTTCSHPNIVRLFVTFQDKANLYYVVELAQKGDLQGVLGRLYALDIPSAKPLLGQVLLALAHIHKKKILHRDLKPENILIDDRNRVKVTDFGTAKMFKPDEPFFVSRSSFVGTADYVSPEILTETQVGPASDLWSFGCVVFTLLVGLPPFHTDGNYSTFMKIEECDYTVPDFVPPAAADLIRKLLVLNPADRLGSGTFDSDYEPIRTHPFFEGIDWATLPRTPIPDFASFPPALRARDAKAAQEQKDAITAESETIVREGYVTFVKNGERQQLELVLSDKPRLFLAEVGKEKMKCEIPLGAQLTATLKAVDTIGIDNAGDTFDLVVQGAEAEAWVESIQAAIANVCE
jgi:3-phosphoinositide dependent protein kinase-1